MYRVDLAGGPIAQVTDLYTGVSGITETSPALSVAQRSGRLVYSVFRANGYELYAIDSPEVLAGRPFAPDSAAGRAAVLPPVERRNPLLVDLLRRTPSSACRRIRHFPSSLTAAGWLSPTWAARR